MTITDLFKELIDTSKDRIKTPISGAFILSFVFYNWRPIAVLLFSNATIEDRIVVINHEYCNLFAIIGPIIIACGYTIGVPKLMLEIDKLLSKTKKERINKIYDDKEIILDGKIRIANKEFDLKNIESGNKEIEDRLEEIDSLKKQIETQKESIKQINQSNKITIDELNRSLKEANSRSSNSLNDIDLFNFQHLNEIVVGDTLELDEKLTDEIIKACKVLTFEEYIVLKNIHIEKGKFVFFKYGEFSDKLLNNLVSKKILKYSGIESSENHEITTTEIGAILLDIIQSI